ETSAPCPCAASCARRAAHPTFPHPYKVRSNPHAFELKLGIAQASRDLRRERTGERGEFIVRERDVDGGGVLFKVLSPLGAGDRHDVVTLREQPGECDLRHGTALLRGHGLDRRQKV